LVPDRGEVFVTVTPSFDLVLYGLVETISATGIPPTTTPVNSTGGQKQHKGISSLALILIIILWCY
jgi:hypothetical protein